MLSVVLNRKDFRESDQLITVYTQDAGKVELLARGVKKINSKNSAFLEPIFLVDLEFVPGKELFHLTKVVPQVCFNKILLNLEKMRLLNYTLKVFNQVVGLGEKDPLLFNLLVSWLNFLNNEKVIAPILADAFLLKFWQILGFKPELSRCVSCGSKEIKCFSAPGGGVLCSDCSLRKPDEKIFAVTPENIQLLDYIVEETFSKISKKFQILENSFVHKLIYHFVSYHSQRPLPEFKNCA